jgi:hypothetical protein
VRSVALPRFWSVERDDDAVVATCPEPLRSGGEDRPVWMADCAAAIREELRSLVIGAGTMLEATLTGEPPPGAGLAGILLANVGIPESQVQDGVRLRRLPPGTAGIVQRYRRVPLIASEDGDEWESLASVTVPVSDGHELETAQAVCLAVVAARPDGLGAPPAGSDLRVRLVVGPGRTRGSVRLVERILDGVCAAFWGEAADAGWGAHLTDTAEVTFVPGGDARLEIELRGPRPV